MQKQSAWQRFILLSCLQKQLLARYEFLKTLLQFFARFFLVVKDIMGNAGGVLYLLSLHSHWKVSPAPRDETSLGNHQTRSHSVRLVLWPSDCSVSLSLSLLLLLTSADNTASAHRSDTISAGLIDICYIMAGLSQKPAIILDDCLLVNNIHLHKYSYNIAWYL